MKTAICRASSEPNEAIMDVLPISRVNAMKPWLKMAGCNPSIAEKNVSAANNGSDLIRAVTHANITVPRFFAKSGGKPPLKGAGWPNIRIIGAGQNGSKTRKFGAWIIQIGRRGKSNRTSEAGQVSRIKSGFQPFPI